ncbi:MAG: hypothetical protein ABJE79_01445 [Marinomonas sp.]
MKYRILKKIFKVFRKCTEDKVKKTDVFSHVRNIVGDDSFNNKDVFFTVVFNIVKIRRGIDKSTSYDDLISCLESNFDYLGNINTRWLVSILDTIADCDKTERASKSLTLSVFINMFKVVETKRKLAWFGGFSFFKLSFQKKDVVCWDGMTYYRVLSGDLLVNMIDRIEREVQGDVLLHEIWSDLLKELKYKNKSFSQFVNLNSLLEKRLINV